MFLFDQGDNESFSKRSTLSITVAQTDSGPVASELIIINTYK